MKRVLIEGWRGINHSYSLVNQFQLLALRRIADLALFHRDLPYYRDDWSPARNAAGFSAAQQAVLDAIPAHAGEPVDAVYRVSFPCRAYGADSERLFCYVTSEYQHVTPSDFYRGEEAERRYRNSAVRFVTPSNWSKQGFVDYGLRAEDVIVIPHGFDPDVFHAGSEDERAAMRRSLGLAEEDFAFLSVGAMTRNKGIDKLVHAFSIIRKKHPHARLLLKDMRALVGFGPERALQELQDSHPGVLDEQVLGAIILLPGNLDLAGMRSLYGACDAYVSPYRAEGFNLPPLEAAACGKPVIVTSGGATEDYFHESFGLRIASTKRSDDTLGTWLDADVESLVHCMASVLEGRAARLDPAYATEWLAERFSWAKVTQRLAALF